MGKGVPAGRLCCCRVAAEQRSRARASGLQCCADPGTLVSLAWRWSWGGLVAESTATTQLHRDAAGMPSHLGSGSGVGMALSVADVTWRCESEPKPGA